MTDWYEFLLRFGINFLSAFVIVRFIYYPIKPNKNYVFTFLMFNTVTYFVMGLLTHVEFSIGVGFGLFAIFSLLRYRTNTIPIRDMTYLFTIIALPVINTFLLISDGWWQLFTTNMVIIIMLFVLEHGWGFHFEESKRITYKGLHMIHPDRRAELIEELTHITGLEINRINIGRINLAQQTAEIKIYFDANIAAKNGSSYDDDSD